MTFPVTFYIGSFPFTAHSILEPLAYFIGFQYFIYLRNKKGDDIPDSNRTWVIIGSILGALIGSRIIGCLERPDELFKAENLLNYVFSNKTILGGLVGGLAGVEIAKKIIKEKRSTGDLFVYPLILAMIIGRVGCFSMGVFEETYGTVTYSPLGLDLGDGLPRHPICLYEITYLFITLMILKSLGKKNLEEGALFKLFMISYLLFRFLIEFIKPHYSYIFGLSIIQLTSIAGLIYYSPYLLYPKKLILQNA